MQPPLRVELENSTPYPHADVYESGVAIVQSLGTPELFLTEDDLETLLTAVRATRTANHRSQQ